MVLDEPANAVRIIGETQLIQQACEIVHCWPRDLDPDRSAKIGV